MFEEFEEMTPEEVARRLEEGGHTGDRNQPHRCPIAQYVASKVPAKPFTLVLTGTEGTRVRTDMYTPDRTDVDYAHPPSVAGFIRAFDAGRYPFLEEK